MDTRTDGGTRSPRDQQWIPRSGFHVNLGIGIPTIGGNYIPAGIDITLQSENGVVGLGPFPTEAEVDPDIINAGKQTITELPYTSYGLPQK